MELEPEPVWFPAWLLLNEKGLARALPSDLASELSGPERSVRILRQLVADSSITHEEQMTLRRALQAEHPGMLKLFLTWKEGPKSGQFPT